MTIRRRVGRVGERLRDLEAVNVREPDVKQHDVRLQLRRSGQTRGPIGRFADDDPRLGLQQRASGGAKRVAVVDDEDCPHVRMLSWPGLAVARVDPDSRESRDSGRPR